MNAFDEASLIGNEGIGILRPYLEEKADGKLVMSNKGKLAKWLQESAGDVVMQRNEAMIGTYIHDSLKNHDR